MSKTYHVVLKQGTVAITPSEDFYTVEFIGCAPGPDVTMQFRKRWNLFHAIRLELDEMYQGSCRDYGIASAGFTRLFIATHGKVENIIHYADGVIQTIMVEPLQGNAMLVVDNGKSVKYYMARDRADAVAKSYYQ